MSSASITPMFGRGLPKKSREPDLFEREDRQRLADNGQRAKACQEFLVGARNTVDFTVAPDSVEMMAAAPYERRARALAS